MQTELIASPADVRALSCKQPWAWMLVEPGDEWKNIENRVPGFSHKSFRGEFYVHATPCSKAYYALAVEWVTRRFGRELASRVPALPKLETGGIIGAARIVWLHPPGERAAPWHMENQHGFVLEDRRQLSFVACKGTLGFWRVPADVLEKIARAA